MAIMLASQMPCLLAALKRNALTCRTICTSTCMQKNVRSGVPKITPNRSKPLTYEQAQKPHEIGVRKSWNSWNTSSLYEEDEKTSETSVQDVFIRKFLYGTWHGLFVSEVIIKRRHNLIVIAGLVHQNVMPRKLYFLLGYTEELLSHLLKRPVKMEIQTVSDKKDVIFKYI